jgi:hypothetical protein
MRRVAVVTAAVAVSMITGISATTAAVAMSSPAPTVVVHVRPVGPAGNLASGYAVTQNHSGANCETGSVAIGDAYRCFTHRYVFDPCWATSMHSYVDCLAAPWKLGVIRLHVTKGYTNVGGLGKGSSMPWGVQLESGHRCLLEQGAGAPIDGSYESYSCHGTKYVLVGGVDKHRKVWKILEAEHRSGGGFKVVGQVPLAQVWLGKRSRKA